MAANLFLFGLLVLTIALNIALKVCSQRIDHRTTPIFISVWSLIGLTVTYPVFHDVAQEAWHIFQARPWLLALCGLKGILLHFYFITCQKLAKVSLSSRIYILPMATGILAVVNSFLGEALSVLEWCAAGSLFMLSALFFMKGHVADVGMSGRKWFLILVMFTVILGATDHTLVSAVNWYGLLAVSNIVLLVFSLYAHCRDTAVLKTAILNLPAILTGVLFTTYDLFKFYQMVVINPTTVVAAVESLANPFILLLSALVWKERTVREQLLWGIGAFFFVILPLIFR